MSYIKETVKCPGCGNKIRTKIYHELSSSNLEMVMDMDYVKIKCSKCNETIVLNYDMKFITDSFHVFYTPNKEEIVDNFPISRITYTHDDFKEKILILNDNLNDLVISFLKCYINDSMKLNEYDGFKELRYNEKKEDSLEFYAIGIDKFLSVPMDYYDNLIKSSKFKKCNEAVLIDEVTFRDYMKVK